MQKVYEEIIEFIARGTTPDNLAKFTPSDVAKARVGELIRRHKNGGLNAEEAAELEHYLQLEHLMRLVKARAPAHYGISTSCGVSVSSASAIEQNWHT